MAARSRWTAVVLAGLLVSAGCSPGRAPVALRDGIVVVENQSRHDWRNVIVTVNDHFRGGSASLAAGGRLTAPLSGFQTAFGQRFDRTHQNVAKIEVTATAADGQAVALAWAGDRAR